jgi:hypothetical protein
MSRPQRNNAKPYTDYGFPTLLEVLPDAIERNSVQEALDLHKDALVSFILKKPHHSHHVVSIGSGFFAYSSDPTQALLVTAKHVLEYFEQHGFGWVTIGSKMIPIGNIGTRLLDPNHEFTHLALVSSFAVPDSIGGKSFGGNNIGSVR